MKTNLKRTTYIEYIVLSIIILSIILLPNTFDWITRPKLNGPLQRSAMILAIFILSFVVLGVHELGHLITGLVQGFKFQLFVIGPLGIKRTKDKIVFFLNKNLQYYGGIAATIPKSDQPENAEKFAKVILAGPITSLLFAILLYTTANFIDTPLAALCIDGGNISLAVFFATTIPSKTGMFFTDRKRYQRLTRPGKDQEAEIALLKILGNFSKDNSYKNIDENDIQTLVEDRIQFYQFFGLYNLICYQLENKGKVDEQVYEEYGKVSKEISKSIVKSFNKEIENYRLKTMS